VKLSRANYDKAHRCPSWSGAAFKYPRGARRLTCDGGSVYAAPYPGRLPEGVLAGRYLYAHPFRFGHCTRCDITVLPLATRWLDPAYLWFKLETANNWLPWRLTQVRAWVLDGEYRASMRKYRRERRADRRADRKLYKEFLEQEKAGASA
jgi:hypothetical protein